MGTPATDAGKKETAHVMWWSVKGRATKPRRGSDGGCSHAKMPRVSWLKSPSLLNISFTDGHMEF